jgi:hypothetical protein
MLRFVGKLVNQHFKVKGFVVFVLSLIVAGFSGYFLFLSTPAENYKTAFIELRQNGFKVTVKGRRVYLSNNPFSAILRSTYEDSISFLIPRQSGIFLSNEIEFYNDVYKPIGTVSINKENMTIELYYDRAQKMSDTWNGEYSLQVRSLEK